MQETNNTPVTKIDWEKLLNRFNLLFTVLAAGFALYISISFTPRLKNLEAQKQEIANKIAEKSFDNDFKFKIFEKVMDAVKSKDTMQLSFTIQYTRTMLADDTIKNILLTLITRNIPKGLITDSLRNQIKTEVEIGKQQAFNRQENQLTSESSTASSAIRVDIFYLENSNQLLTYQKAKALQDGLGNKYQVRVRLLPASVNNRAGYNIGVNQIRFETSEKSVASQLKNDMAASGITGFTDHISSQSTPNYISVFIVQ